MLETLQAIAFIVFNIISSFYNFILTLGCFYSKIISRINCISCRFWIILFHRFILDYLLFFNKLLSIKSQILQLLKPRCNTQIPIELLILFILVVSLSNNSIIKIILWHMNLVRLCLICINWLSLWIWLILANIRIKRKWRLCLKQLVLIILIGAYLYLCRKSFLISFYQNWLRTNFLFFNLVNGLQYLLHCPFFWLTNFFILFFLFCFLLGFLFSFLTLINFL